MKHGKNMSNIEMVRSMLKGERPFTQVGYTGNADKYIVRKVGETWTDARGKNWIQKESGPQTVTPIMDMIREEANEKCTSCGTEVRWGKRLDQKMYHKTKKCFDCLIKEETALRIKGKYKLYEQRKMLSNEMSYLEDLRQKLKESQEYLKTEGTLKFVNSNGMVEEWQNEAKDELAKSIKKDFVKCLKEIKRVKAALDKANDEIDTALLETK